MEAWAGGGEEAALEGELFRVGGEEAGGDEVGRERPEGTKEELREGIGTTDDDGEGGAGRASKGAVLDCRRDTSSEAGRSRSGEQLGGA